ncbi:MAG: hypothetical protein DRH17_00945 [Deltaproteobacteria bacterium]|nr:MAG: hypothetical protein DRH17_00945 [Deltaproteobacteria bacterium]
MEGKLEFTIIKDKGRFRTENRETQRLVASETRAKEMMNWKAQTPLKEGLDKTAGWIQGP